MAIIRNPDGSITVGRIPEKRPEAEPTLTMQGAVPEAAPAPEKTKKKSAKKAN